MIFFFSPETQGRYERKFVTSTTFLWAVESQILLHSALFRKVYQPRFVNNIYLDSPDFTHYLDNVEGNSKRRKVRVRWYGDLEGEVKTPVLELKEKAGHIGWKSTFPLPPFHFSNRFNARRLQKIMEQADLSPALLQNLHSLRPTLVNRYHRKYYLSKDERFRITLDDQQTYYRISHLYNNISFPSRSDEQVIMELKYLEEHDAEAGYITNGFRCRVGKYSKYLSGLTTLMST